MKCNTSIRIRWLKETETMLRTCVFNENVLKIMGKLFATKPAEVD